MTGAVESRAAAVVSAGVRRNLEAAVEGRTVTTTERASAPASFAVFGATA
jgi:hypothetical protein